MYSETEEVAKILMEMLDDLATRLSVIDEVDAQAQQLVDDAYAKMIEWEKKLVVLANGESCSFALEGCTETQEQEDTALLVARTGWQGGKATCPAQQELSDCQPWVSEMTWAGTRP